jgi:hypothetical protein
VPSTLLPVVTILQDKTKPQNNHETTTGQAQDNHKQDNHKQDSHKARQPQDKRTTKQDKDIMPFVFFLISTILTAHMIQTTYPQHIMLMTRFLLCLILLDTTQICRPTLHWQGFTNLATT